MPGFRRWGKSKFTRNPESSFKLLAAVLVITFYRQPSPATDQDHTAMGRPDTTRGLEEWYR
jgi:hypothetical protein